MVWKQGSYAVAMGLKGKKETLIPGCVIQLCTRKELVGIRNRIKVEEARRDSEFFTPEEEQELGRMFADGWMRRRPEKQAPKQGTSKGQQENKGISVWLIPVVFGSIGIAPGLLWTGLVTARNFDAHRAAKRPAIDSSSRLEAKAECEQFIKTLQGDWECKYFDKVLEWNLEYRKNKLLTWLFRPENGPLLKFEEIGIYTASEITSDDSIGEDAKSWHFEK